MTNNPKFLIVDLFCGAGGTTTGFEMAGGIARVIACVNHDARAIKSHWRNHKHVRHFNEDIRTLDLTKLVRVVKWWQKKYPNAKLILWASLECTNFSKAKGGLPRDADSRTLADHLHRYIEALNPDIIQIENVVEFMSWGPLDTSGKPMSNKNGSDWLRWRREICAHGYVDEWKELNSADFGAYTSRNRLFGMFARTEAEIRWPEPTHAKKPGTGKMFDQLERWKPVKDVLDFTDEGESIFNRKKPLSDKTYERIYAGLVKYVANGDKAFISKYFSGRPAGKVNSIESPSSTITTFGGSTLVQPISLLKYNSTSKDGKHVPPSLEDPCPVVAAQNRLGLVSAEYLVQRNGGNPEHKIVDVNGPARTLTATAGNMDVVFLSKYHGKGLNIISVNDVCSTITTKDRISKVAVQHFIDKQFSGTANHQSIEQPAGSILTNDKHSVVTARPFVMPTSYSNKPASIDAPAPTIQASRRHHYLVNPSWGGNPGSVEQPCPVIIARQDKAPLYLIQIEDGLIQVPVYDQDSEIVIQIKQFMALYGLVDIKMRMLRVPELLKIQGFPDNYILEGNQSDQKKFIGNSVVPLVVKNWIESIGENLEIAA